jgi:DNA-directed RNA polymerase specialized sigma24 family protein
MKKQEIRSDPADRELVARAEDRRTRQAALDAIYAKYGQKVLRYCAARLNEKAFAPDAAQDTFADLTEHFVAGNTVRENLGGFLYTVARHRLTRYMREWPPEGHRPALDPLTLTGGTDGGSPDDDRSHADAITIAEDEAGVLRVRRILEEHVVPSLSERHRRIYDHSVRRGLTGAPLAEALETTPDAAKRDTNYFRSTVMVRALAAYLLFKNSIEHGSERCRELDRIIAPALSISDLDTAFTEELREEIRKHFDICPTCGNCRVCGPLQMRLIAELTPVLIPILYAAEARDRALNAIRQVCAQEPISPPRFIPPGGGRPISGNRGKRRAIKIMVPLLALLLIIAAVMLSRPKKHTAAPPPPRPTPVAAPGVIAVDDRGEPIDQKALGIAQEVLADARRHDGAALARLAGNGDVNGNPQITEQNKILARPGAFDEVINILTRTHGALTDGYTWPGFTLAGSANPLDRSDMSLLQVSDPKSYHGLRILIGESDTTGATGFSGILSTP